jgi:hypothetical protein
MFDEFEVVCPECDAILRLSSEGYKSYIKKLEDENLYQDSYEFPCLKCYAKLEMTIKVKLKKKGECTNE